MSNSYAFITEVYGDSLFGSKSNKSKHSSNNRKEKDQRDLKKDPSCYLYKKRDGSKHQLDDIMTAYMDQDNHGEVVYQKYQPMYNHPQRIKSSYEVDMIPSKLNYDTTDEEAAVVEEESRRSHQRKQSKTKCYDPDRIVGFEESQLASQAFEYDSYYKNDPSMAFVQDEDTSTSSIIRQDYCGSGDRGMIEESFMGGSEVRAREEVPSKTEIYKDIIERYENLERLEKELKQKTTKSSSGYIELVLYVLSGVILIFMMEQVLRLGVYLR